MLYQFGADGTDGSGYRIEVREGLVTHRINTWDSLTFFRQTHQTPP